MAKITFTDISIENLGPFRERQTLPLSVRDGKPVILIKALNGSGKTTLLTAIQIALYGYKAINLARKSEYDQLIQSLLRQDAVGNAAVEVNLLVEVGGRQQPVAVRREWRASAGSLQENMTVSSHGMIDMAFTESWDEFINGILPAELVQLFLFDGEKIEALASPDRLPELLRRATEVFLGLGGIDSLATDLKAVERRANLRNKESSGEHAKLREDAEKFAQQLEETEQSITVLQQKRASLQNTLDAATSELERYKLDAQRQGLTAYEQAAELKAEVDSARKRNEHAQAELIDAIEHPLLPLTWLGPLWDKYKTQWDIDQQAQNATLLASEFEKRDSRLLQQLPLPSTEKQRLAELLQADLLRFKAENVRQPVLQAGGNPHEIQPRLEQAVSSLQKCVAQVTQAESTLSKAERAVGKIPAGEQLASVLGGLQQRAHTVAKTESDLLVLTAKLSELQTYRTHTETRLNAAHKRLQEEFKDKALEQHGLQAAGRAKKTLLVFRERLLASKAAWLSDMITQSFQQLLRKKRLVAKVNVDPDTYTVSIIDTAGHMLPMERLSAGERQILAISVLSALIQERKGRFPVVVDTPLARLDQKHRESLINNFFGKVSHQVLVLSTDEEVHGPAYTALQPYMAASMGLEFDEVRRSTVVVAAEI